MNERRRYFLRTRRLGFSEWRESDGDLALSLWGDPQVMRQSSRQLARAVRQALRD